MARIKRYDLYEGDGETIGEEENSRSQSRPLPGKRPLGREDDLRRRDAAAREAEWNYTQRRRVFAENETEDGKEEPSSLFDDFDQPAYPLPERPARKRKKLKHRGAWAACIVFSLMGILACSWILVPQLTGSRFRFLPAREYPKMPEWPRLRRHVPHVHLSLKDLRVQVLHIQDLQEVVFL